MRMSCNGCRVLRKGCSDTCTIRPCLQWIKNPESQANATVFLAKFYGRAGLMNLIDAGPHDLRPAIFRSLLYEACGRIVNPIYGSVGLLWSGSWHVCQAAVEAVLNGKPIVQIPIADHAPPPPFTAAYDIRHVAASADLHKVTKTTRTRFKKSSSASRADKASRTDRQFRRAKSHESADSEETAEASHVSQAEPSGREESEVELELTLGFEPARPAVRPEPEPKRVEMDGWNDYSCEVELGLELRN